MSVLAFLGFDLLTIGVGGLCLIAIAPFLLLVWWLEGRANELS